MQVGVVGVVGAGAAHGWSPQRLPGPFMEHDFRSLNASNVLHDEEQLCAEAKAIVLNERHQ